MDISQYFHENQNLLLELVNTEAGKEIVRRLSGKEDRKITHITPNSYIADVGEQIFTERGEEKIYQGVFYSRQPLAKIVTPSMEYDLAKKYGKVSNTEEAFAHYAGLERKMSKYPLFLFLSSPATFTPTSGSSSPVDGYVGRSGVNESLATIRSSAGNTFNNTATSGNDTPQILSSSTSSQYQQLLRNIYCFDTHTLTLAAKISAAKLSLFAPAANEKSNQLGSSDLHAASATPASTSTLANSDFGNVGTTSFGSIAYASYIANQYNDITFNANGIANIDPTGISKYSTQLSWDILNNFTGAWAGLSQSAFRAKFADDGSNLPSLIVTFTLPAGGFLTRMLQN